jgi:hypothetical protein
MRLLPAVRDPTRIPGGELTSVAQTLSAFARQLEALTGTTWDALPVTSASNTALKDSIQDVTLGLHGGRLDILEDQGYAAIVKAATGAGAIVVSPLALTDILFAGADEYDPKNWHNPSGANPERVTVSVSGLYLLTANLSIMPASAPASGYAEMVFTKNGVGSPVGAASASFIGVTPIQSLSGSRAIYLAAGDYVGVNFFHTCKDGGSADIDCTIDQGSLSVVKVR